MAKKSVKLAITYKNHISDIVSVGCGVYLALSMAKGLMKEKDNISEIVVLDCDNEIFGCVRYNDVF